MSRRVIAVVGVMALAGVAWFLLHVGSRWNYQIVDYGVYQKYGDSMAHHRLVPYRDFQLEYPPGALPVFIAPSLLDSSNYDFWFQVLMFVCDEILVVAVAAIGGVRAAAIAAIAPLALGSVVLSRYDLWPAVLAALALWFVLQNRLRLSAVFLGTAAAAKLWPAALLPLFLIWVLRCHGRRAGTHWSLSTLGTIAVWFVPFAILSPSGVLHSFHAQLARPLQIESLGAAVLLAVHHAAGTSLAVASSFGSQNLVGSGVKAVEVATSILGAVALVTVWVLFLRRPLDRQQFLVSCAGAVAALVAFGKVFSPQFTIWLIPLVVLVRGARGVAASALLIGSLILTQTWFPDHYWDLATRMSLNQANLVLARDICIVALFVVLAWPSQRREAALTRSGEPPLSPRSVSVSPQEVE
jgi:uncharacterized membrane protein